MANIWLTCNTNNTREQKPIKRWENNGQKTRSKTIEAKFENTSRGIQTGQQKKQGTQREEGNQGGFENEKPKRSQHFFGRLL